MQGNTLKKNFLYQYLYQFVILVIPLIISPYLTRVLGDTGLGNYSYINSLAYYFVILANLGIAKHGQRVISQNRNDDTKLRKIFWSLYIIHSIISVVAIVFYIGFILIVNGDHPEIYWIELLYVASALFDITWLFYGIERFRTVVIRNLIIKVVECVLIFTLIKSVSDLWIYATIIASGTFLSQLAIIPSAIKTVKPIKVSKEDILSHWKPLLIFSISVFAIILYTVFDKTLLGLFSTKENVAYYEYANKILVLPRTFISVIGVVLFPRACKMAADGDYEKQRYYLNLSLLVVCFIGFGSMFGLLGVGKDFAYYYYGESFETSGLVLQAMCAIPLIVGLGDVVRTQYLIPNHMDKQYIVCILINAVINLVLSFALIPAIGIYGAIIGTFCAELFGTVFQVIVCRKSIVLKQLLALIIMFSLIGGTMFGLILIINTVMERSLLRLIIGAVSGLVLFVGISFLFIYVFNKKHKEKGLQSDTN